MPWTFAAVNHRRRRLQAVGTDLMSGRLSLVDFVRRTRGYARRRIERRGIRVSVIVAIYNGMPYLPALLESLAAQDIGAEHRELLLIDDGSTDETPSVLDEFAARVPGVVVIHQANSGWPGAPRNRGLELARGRYVFFADADDYLRLDSLRRLADYADRHQSDVVIPRVKPIEGRRGGGLFPRSVVSVRLSKALKTFTPHKLIRRSLLTAHGIRFPEGKVRLEDGIVITECYLRARRISALADKDYYFLRARADHSNLSVQPADPPSYVNSVDRITVLIEQLAPEQQREKLIMNVFRRKCLRIYRPAKFLPYKRPRQQLWLDAHRAYIERHVTVEMEQSLPARWQRRCHLVRTNALDELIADLQAEKAAAS